MNEQNKRPVKRRTVRLRATSSLRYAPHEAPLERDHPVMSAALFADEEKAARLQTEQEDLLDGMM